jgi:hypothetical protein
MSNAMTTYAVYQTNAAIVIVMVVQVVLAEFLADSLLVVLIISLIQVEHLNVIA